MVFPQGHIDISFQTMKEEIFRNNLYGEYHSERYYFVVVSESLWNSCLSVLNIQADREQCLSLLDINYWCKKAKINSSIEDDGKLLIKLNNHRYCFMEDRPHPPYWIHGGPTDYNGKYEDFDVEIQPPLITGKTFVKLLLSFETSIESMYPKVKEKIFEFQAQWKRQQIMRTHLLSIFEQYLFDMQFQYRLSSDDNGECIEIWLPTSEETVFSHISLPYRNIISLPENYCNMIRIIKNDPDKWTNFGNVVELSYGPVYCEDIYCWNKP